MSEDFEKEETFADTVEFNIGRIEEMLRVAKDSFGEEYELNQLVVLSGVLSWKALGQLFRALGVPVPAGCASVVLGGLEFRLCWSVPDSSNVLAEKASATPTVDVDDLRALQASMAMRELGGEDDAEDEQPE